uniref:Ku domain-containing protein n=1 Tax=Elphidium margaritaceum TaxID=933848 RepID=A0A7S0TC33_9EUKA
MAAILLLNSSTTNNVCHEEHGGYDCIEEHVKLSTPSLDLLECIDNVQCNESGVSGDPLDAILVSAEIIMSFVGTKKYTKRIFMLTDGGTAINDADQLDSIAQSFVDNDIQLNCILMNKNEHADDHDADDAIESWRDIQLDNDGGGRSAVQIENEKMLRYFALRCHGNVFSGQSAIAMMSELRAKSVLMRPTFSGYLEVSASLRIACKMYCRCREQALPSLKKESLLSSSADNTKVEMNRKYVNKFAVGGADGDGDGDRDETERVKSYLYGQERIPFSENDESRLSYHSGERHFKCLYFCKASLIARHYFMASSFVVLPDTASARAQLLLSCFVRSLHEKQMVMLCRLVSRKNAPPKFVVLQPRIKSGQELFILNELPFFEDVRKFPFASFAMKSSYVASKAQVDCCKQLIRSMSLMPSADADADEDADAQEALRPQQTFNPVLQRFYQNLSVRALDPQAALQEIDAVIVKYLNPSVLEAPRAQHCVAQLAKLFPTKLVPKKEVKKERAHWNQVGDALDNLFADMQVDAKQDDAEAGAGADADMELDALIVVEQVTEIGTAHPCQDFDSLFSKKNAPNLFETLSVSFWLVIHRLVDESFGDFGFDKALKCIEFHKSVSIREEECMLFNQELRKFKAKYSEKNKALWRELVQRGITLICKQDFAADAIEVPVNCTVTKQDADNFMNMEMPPQPAAQVVAQDEDDDDVDDLV